MRSLTRLRAPAESTVSRGSPANLPRCRTPPRKISPVAPGKSTSNMRSTGCSNALSRISALLGGDGVDRLGFFLDGTALGAEQPRLQAVEIEIDNRCRVERE